MEESMERRKLVSMKANYPTCQPLIVTLGCLFLLLVPLSAQTTTGEPPVREQPVILTPTLPVSVEITRSEMRAYQRILKKSAAVNINEIALSREALSRSTNPRVRAFAEMMVRDHDRMGRELTTLAARRGVMLADSGSSPENSAELSQKTGIAYDQAYIEEMIAGHEDAIALFEKASRSKDPDIAAFAVQYLPTLREHLTHSLQLEELFD